jgi:hypothetical protein
MLLDMLRPTTENWPFGQIPRHSPQKNNPTVTDSAMVYVFPTRQNGGLREESRNNEMSEQAVIALLGQPYLLNLAMTDFVDWELGQVLILYRQAFVAIGIDTISRMSPDHQPPF